MEHDSVDIKYNTKFPESLDRFCNAYNKNHPGKNADMHNMYLLQTVDRDGNITGEAYGINLLTNNGFQKSIIPYKYIFIGEGTGAPAITDTTLFSALTTTASTISDDRESYYAMKYYSTTGIISQKRKIVTGYFDYTIFSETKTITELGLGNVVTNLYSHALIYDSEGNISSITKNINERLYIHVYWNICMKKDIFNNSYDNGMYLLLEPVQMLNSSFNAYNTYVNSFSYPDSNGNSFTIPAGTIDNNVKTGTTNTMPSVTIEGLRDYITMSCAYNRYNRMLIRNDTVTSLLLFWKEDLDTPEELTCDNIYTDSDTEAGLTNNFLGKRESYNSDYGYGEFPVDQFNMTSVSMYNHIDKDWTITELFTNGPNSYFNYRTFNNALRLLITDNFSIDRNVNVFVNDKTNIPIDSFSDTGIVLYATDEFWDSSTWSLISDLTNVPSDLRTKRYFICVGRDADNGYLQPHRDQIYHKINISGQYYETKPSCPDISYSSNYCNYDVKMLSSDAYDLISNRKHIIFHPNDENSMVKYSIDRKIEIFTSADGSYNMHRHNRWIIGDRMVVSHCSSSDSYSKLYNRYLQIYDVTNPLIFQTSDTCIELGFTNETIKQPFYSYNNGDFLTCQDMVNNEAIIVKIHNESGSYGVNVSANNLPDYLQEVDYITSTGTEYIDTFYKPKANTKIEWDGIVYQNDDVSYNAIFGVFTSRGGSSTFPAYSFYTKYNGTYAPCLITRVNNINVGTDFVYDTRVKIVTSVNKATWYVDDTEIGSLTSSNYSFIDGGSTMFVFDDNRSYNLTDGKRNSRYYAKASLYSFKVYEDDTLVGNYVPCYRKSDNVIGLYNVTSSIFCPANNSVAQTKLTNVRNMTTLIGTDNCVCRTSDGLTFNVIDMNTSEVVNSFEITDDGFTFDGIVGWKNYIYIRVIDSTSVASTYIYDTNTEILSYQASMDVVGMIYSASQKVVANDECIVISNDHIANKKNNKVDIITVNSPYVTNCQLINESYYDMYSMDLRYYNDSKQLLLLMNYQDSSNYYNYAIIDVGYIIDNGPYTTYPIRRSANSRTDKYGYLSIGISMFKGEIVTLSSSIDSYANRFSWRPVEYLIRHKVVGTTTTIQSYNNPKRISGRSWTYKLTNDTSLWEASTTT